MLSDTDWELISGYADGELSADQEADIARRLTVEPALAAALAEIRGTKRGLALMRPAETPAAVPLLSGAGWRLGVAACLAAAVAFGAAFQLGGWSEDWRDTPAILHDTLSGNTYVLPESVALPVVSTSRIGDVRAFDLSSSRLFLVDLQSSRHAGRDVVAMHYRGRNGCRLTVIALEAMLGDPVELPVRHDGLGARWTTAGIHFYLLASGMDRNRFDAIARYAKAESLRPARDSDLRVAMSSATEKAHPCV